jgi:chemotaxis protein CheD
MMHPPCLARSGLPLGHVSIGDCAFALKPIVLTTVLGSCVCVTFHHPQRRAGGMFHAMLPDKGLRRSSDTRACTFADLAVAAMLERFLEAGMAPAELTVKIFGGANTMEAGYGGPTRDMLDVGRKNVNTALAALATHGLDPVSRDVLGARGRKLFFSTVTGEVWLSYLTPALARSALARSAEALRGRTGGDGQ